MSRFGANVSAQRERRVGADQPEVRRRSIYGFSRQTVTERVTVTGSVDVTAEQHSSVRRLGESAELGSVEVLTKIDLEVYL